MGYFMHVQIRKAVAVEYQQKIYKRFDNMKSIVRNLIMPQEILENYLRSFLLWQN